MTSDVLFFRGAFLRHAPRRYALMLAPAEAQRRNQKYDEKRGDITDDLIRRHLAGDIALAELRVAYHENPSGSLPTPPLPASKLFRRAAAS